MTANPSPADLEPCLDFARRLIRTEGLPGNERETAELMRDEMEKLGYADVQIDAAGNALGCIRGGSGSALMFNTHLDHVDVGDHDRWPHPPFGAEIHDACIWGRGAVDIKGPLAAQVYGVARLLNDTAPPAGDVWVSAVVQEEIGGVGARYLATQMQPQVVVIGEPSSNQLRRGHRGRSLLTVHITGRSVHASVPEKGVNPYDVLAQVIARLPELDMATQEDLGRSSVAPTLIRTDQTSSNGNQRRHPTKRIPCAGVKEAAMSVNMAAWSSRRKTSRAVVPKLSRWYTPLIDSAKIHENANTPKHATRPRLPRPRRRRNTVSTANTPAPRRCVKLFAGSVKPGIE